MCEVKIVKTEYGNQLITLQNFNIGDTIIEDTSFIFVGGPENDELEIGNI